MPSDLREVAGGYVYHVINHGVGRMIFLKDKVLDLSRFLSPFS